MKRLTRRGEEARNQVAFLKRTYKDKTQKHLNKSEYE